MNRTTLGVVGGVFVGLAVGTVASSRVAGAQARPIPTRVPVQDAQCFVDSPLGLAAWLGARTREGYVLSPGVSVAYRGANPESTAMVCVTRPVQ
jgi:hypothetical protein